MKVQFFCLTHKIYLSKFAFVRVPGKKKVSYNDFSIEKVLSLFVATDTTRMASFLPDSKCAVICYKS